MSSTSANNNTSPHESSNEDPYFLHHSDGPGLVLVSQILTGENYAAWSRSMVIALSVKNKLDFVDGTLPQPDPIHQTRYRLWTRNNNVVISWILNSVSKEISASIIYLKTASDMWKELKERFQQSNGPRIFQIKRELINLTQDSDSVSTYFTKLKVLWEELANYNTSCTCGRCICGGAKETEHTISFLMGLNDSFAQIRGQILLMDPIPNVNKIFSLIIQEERQRDVSGITPTSTVAFNVRSNNDSRNSSNQRSGNQNYKNFKRDNPPFCTHCNKSRHTQEKCYRLHGFPPGYRTSRNHSDSRANSVTVNSQSATDDSKISNMSNTNEAKIGLTQDQCENLIAYLSEKLASTNLVTTSSNPDSDFIKEDDWQG